MGSVHSALSYIGDIMFFEFRGYKDLTDPDPVLLPFIINIEQVLYTELRDDWRWVRTSTFKLQPVLIVWLNCTRGEISTSSEVNRFTPHLLYLVGREPIDEFRQTLLQYR